MTIRAVLYDFDGTLADSTDLIMRCYRHTMTRHLGKSPPDEEWLSGFGTPLEAQLRRFARSEAEFVAMLDSYVVHQRDHHDQLLRPFPEAVETVTRLAEKGIGLAIVTSKHRHATLQGLELCSLTRHFQVIVTPEDVRMPKPDAEPVLLALSRLGVAPSEAIFVGDSPHDIAAGRAAHVRTAAALWGPFSRGVLEAENPDSFLESQGDVLDLIAAG
ncbi:HAD family hydrolase [soil metagenome]